jgi:hypothetical protein
VNAGPRDNGGSGPSEVRLNKPGYIHAINLPSLLEPAVLKRSFCPRRQRRVADDNQDIRKMPCRIFEAEEDGSHFLL